MPDLTHVDPSLPVTLLISVVVLTSVMDMQVAEKEANQIQREEEKAEERRRAKVNKTLKKSHKSKHTAEKRKPERDEASGEKLGFYLYHTVHRG